MFLNLLIKPFWVLGIGVSVQKAVGPETYGIYFAMLNFSFLFQIVLDFGINNYQNRMVSRDPEFLKKKLFDFGLIKLVLGVLFMAVVLSVGKWVMHYSDFYLFLLLLVAINQVLLSLLLFIRANLAGLQLFKTDSIISVLDRTLMIVICGVLLWGNVAGGTFRIEWFAYAQTASYILTIAVALGVVLKHSSPEFELGFLRKLLPSLRSTFPYALLTLIMTLYYRVDAVMIETMLPDGALKAGIYAQGYKLLETASMFAFLFATLLFPMFSGMLARKESIVHLMDLSFRLLVAPAILLAAVVWFYSYELMAFLYIDKVEETARIVPVLMATFIPLASTYVFGTLLTAGGDLRRLNIISLAGLVVNLALNWWLIPTEGIYGAAIATLATQGVVVGFQIYVVVRVFYLKPNYKLLLSLAVFVSGLAAFGYLVQSMPLSPIQGMVLLTLAGMAWAFITRMINIKNIYEIIRFG